MDVIYPDKFQAMIISCDKKENKCDLNINNSIIISFVDSVTLLVIEVDNKLNFEKLVSTIISFYIFYQGNIIYCVYISILLFIFYYIKVVRFSLDHLPCFLSLLTCMLLQKNCINNGVTNGLKYLSIL